MAHNVRLNLSCRQSLGNAVCFSRHLFTDVMNYYTAHNNYYYYY